MRKLYLSKTDKKIFGICGGIGETYDIDSSLIRLSAILLCLVTAIIPVVITYFAAWLIIPEKKEE